MNEASSMGAKLQNIHDTRQQHKMWDEFQWGSSTDTTAEARGLLSYQGITAMNICKERRDKWVHCGTHCNTPQLSWRDIFFFVSFLWRRLQLRVLTWEGRYVWDWSGWCEIHKESKGLKIKINKTLSFTTAITTQVDPKDHTSDPCAQVTGPATQPPSSVGLCPFFSWVGIVRQRPCL